MLINDYDNKEFLTVKGQILTGLKNDLIAKIEELLNNNLTNSEKTDIIIELDEYCGVLDDDDRWIPMDNLDDELGYMSPSEILTDCREINPYDDYFKFDGYDWISTNDLDYSDYWDKGIEEAIINNWEDLDKPRYALDDETVQSIEARVDIVDALEGAISEITRKVVEMTSQETSQEETQQSDSTRLEL